MKIKLALLTFGLITMLFLIACQSEKERAMINTPLATVTNTVKAQVPLEPTPTLLPPTTTKAQETTSAPVNVPVASATVVLETTTSPSVLVTSTVTAVTLTPLPTLAADELEAAVAELLANPMNCDVPCWWGAVPGTTKIEEIKHFLSPYNFDIVEYEVEGQTYLRVGIGYVKERNDFEEIIVYGFSDSVLTGVTAYTPSIADILTKFGQPDEIWLSTGITPVPIPVRLNLVYYQEGMAVGYVVDGFVENHMFNGCFAAEEKGSLRLILPHSATSYEAFPTIFEDDRRYLPLEEATSLTMEDFMQRFSDPSQPQCIETPIEIWD